MLRSMFAQMPFSFVIFIASFLSFAISVAFITQFNIDNSWTNSTATMSSLIFLCSISWTVYDLYVLYRISKNQAIKLIKE